MLRSGLILSGFLAISLAGRPLRSQPPEIEPLPPVSAAMPAVAVPGSSEPVALLAQTPANDPPPAPGADADPEAIQNAPGDDDGDPPDLYETMLREADSDLPGVWPVPLADYAPYGYEAREFQDAPGAPEFVRIDPPVRVSAEDREKFVVRGIMPGSFLVPGTNTSFRLRGFVRLTGLYDFDPIGSRDDFVTNTIPVPQQVGQNQNISARYSRFAIETWTPTNINDWNAHTFIEGDFFNGPNQAVGGGGNPFRLRFAFVDFGYFRFGQQNTVFMDGNAWPSTVDFAGPRGLVNQRRPSARMTLPLGCDGWYWATGVEGPFSDITTNGQGTAVQNIPDVATHIRYEADRGHVQLSGVARSIGYRPDFGEVTRRSGWGVSGSTVFHPWAVLLGTNPVRDKDPCGLTRSRILAQYTFGWGIGRYIQDTAALGLDGQVDPLTGSFNTLYTVGWSTSYEHWFNDKWLWNTTYSEDFVGNNGGQPASTYRGAKYLATSAWFIPVRNMSLGVEYVWGQRANIDLESARADRLNALFQYNF
jgi:hypothetical protein